jgi:hypothetical protein
MTKVHLNVIRKVLRDFCSRIILQNLGELNITIQICPVAFHIGQERNNSSVVVVVGRR